MKNVLQAIFFLLLSLPARSGPGEKNQLLEAIRKQQHYTGYEKDTTYILRVAQLAHLYYSTNTDSIFFYANYALKLSRQVNYKKGIAESLRQLGNAYMLIGDMPQSLAYYQQSLHAAEQMHDRVLTCYAVSNIGLTYSNLEKYDEALGYSLRAYSLATEIGDSLRIAGELSNLADIYFARKEYSTAFNNAQKALQIARSLKNDYYEAFLSNSLANMLSSSGQYPEAMRYYMPALDFYKKTGDKLGLTNTYLYIAKVYFKTQKSKLAINYALQSLALATSRSGKRDIADVAGLLADVYEVTGDNKNALLYLRLAKKYNDSLFNDETQKKLYELQVKFSYEQKEAVLKEEQVKKDLLNSQALKDQQQKIVIAGIVIFSLCIIVIALYKSRANKLKNNKVLQQMNREILQQKEELQMKAVELNKSNALKDKLFSILAHDLRSPFISLQSLLALFKDGSLPEEEVKAIFSKLDVNVDYTVNLVTNLLSWALSQMNGIIVKPARVPIKELFAGVVAGMEKRASDKGITLVYNAQENLAAFADTDMVQLILRNLLSNAIKFCTAGDIISIAGVEKDGMVEISITDTGIGITPDVIIKINAGESVTTYGTLNEKGTGLGLLLCKDFTERNQGHFFVDSLPGGGSRFSFTLPAAQ